MGGVLSIGMRMKLSLPVLIMVFITILFFPMIFIMLFCSGNTHTPPILESESEFDDDESIMKVHMDICRIK